MELVVTVKCANCGRFTVFFVDTDNLSPDVRQLKCAVCLETVELYVTKNE